MICDINFISVRKAKCCSERCRQILRINNKNTGVEGYDYISCPVCDQRVKQITIKHAKTHGYRTANEMKKDLNLDYVTCQKVKDNNSGNNNPAYQHNGKFSKFSKNFIHGYDKEWHTEWATRHSEFRNNNKELFKTNIEYWLDQCDGDIEQAQQEYTKFQTRDLDYFVNKHGEEEGHNKHRQKIERWINSIPCINFSVVSQLLFDEIMEKYKYNPEDIYYATYDRKDMALYENKEFRLKTDTSFVMPDFIDLGKKKIIEFDGDYWHSESKVNPQREYNREQAIIKKGYTIKHVREQDYKQNKEKVIQECLDFLNK